MIGWVPELLTVAGRIMKRNVGETKAFSSPNAPPSWARPAPTAAMPQGRPPHGELQLRCRATSAGLIHPLSRYPRVLKTSLNLPVLKTHFSSRVYPDLLNNDELQDPRARAQGGSDSETKHSHERRQSGRLLCPLIQLKLKLGLTAPRLFGP
jgi:hypothetical protein